MALPKSTAGMAGAFADADFSDGDWQDEGAIDQGSLFGRLPTDPRGVGALADDREDLRRGRGRPAGSANKSTTEWARFLLTRYRSPLIGMAEIAQATPKKIKNELGCDLLEAMRIIQTAQANLAPYLHQKQPTAIDTGGGGLLQIIIGDTGGGDQGGVTIQPIQKTEQNQGVTIDVQAVSEAEGRKE